MSVDQLTADLMRDLESARKAWATKATAESQLARLRGYARLTPGMKDDQRRWSGLLSESEATLRRVLGPGQPGSAKADLEELLSAATDYADVEENAYDATQRVPARQRLRSRRGP